jgi:hypothetical protein
VNTRSRRGEICYTKSVATVDAYEEAGMRGSITGLGIVAAAAVALSGPAVAWDEIVAQRGWTQVDYSEAGDCRAEVRGNGQFYRIAGEGLRPGEVVSFRLANSDVRPVEYRIVADSDGAWRKFYVPFLWHRDGGTVLVHLQSASCTLNLAFDWRRRRA